MPAATGERQAAAGKWGTQGLTGAVGAIVTARGPRQQCAINCGRCSAACFDRPLTPSYGLGGQFPAWGCWSRPTPGFRGTHDMGESAMRPFAKNVVKFLKAEDGPTAVEYAVMLALIIVVCIATVTALGNNANNTFQTVNNALPTGS
jgi:pilus assembly protein Flp/PilA